MSSVVQPSKTETVSIILGKTLDGPDQPTWEMTFVLQEWSPPITIIQFGLLIDAKYHSLAEETFAGGLDDAQISQAKIAAALAKDPNAADHEKLEAAGRVIAVRVIAQPSVPDPARSFPRA